MAEASKEILDRIAKLLAMTQADAGTTEGEIENAMRLARKLMDQHNLTMEQVKAARGDKDDPTVGIHERDTVRNRQWPRWMEVLAGATAALTDTRTYFSHESARTVHGNWTSEITARFVGYPTDTAVAAALLPYLITTVRAMARARYGSGWLTPHRTYALGFAQRIWERAVDLQAHAGQGTDDPTACKAIVLSKQDNIKRYMEDNLSLESRKVTRRRVSDYGAYSRGRADAENVNLGTDNILQ